MRSRPWWLWLASASFIGYFVFLHLAIYYERESFGFNNEVRPGGVYVVRVGPGTAAERMGLQIGDRLVALNGLRNDSGNDFSVAVANEPINAAGEWQVDRAGQIITLTTPPLARQWVVPGSAFPLGTATLGLSLILGLAILWRGPQNTQGRLAGWLLLSLGCVFLPLFPNSMATEWRSLPAPVQLLLMPAAMSSTLVHLLLVSLCASMAGSRFSRTQLAIAMIPGAAVAALVVWYSGLTFYAPIRAVEMWFPHWLNFVGPLTYPAYFFAGAWLLVRGLRRATDPTDRRRLQILLAGIGCGAAGLFLFGLLLGLTRTGLMNFGDSALVAVVILFTLLPVSFAYATLRHRLFDLRVVVRIGLQYAMARGVMFAVIPIMITALIADAILHGDQPLQAILADRGWSYAIVAAIAGVVHVKRDEWMDALDRRFFRERYAAQQILREVVEDIGRSSNFGTGAQKVVGRIESALHPVMTAVMIKPRTATTFSAVASSGHAVPVLAANSPIPQVARALGKPITTGTLGLSDVAELVVPIAVDANGDEALLVLGARKSEEPYSKEDQDLLSAIATSLRMLMGRSDPGATVTVAPSMQLIGNRYRIERQIGEGGMGMVFAAVDETLERPVAIKVIRDQHLTGDALTRFQREARTAASLSHPNIVTIHDFGTDEAGSPFLVMELLDGRSLRYAIKTEGRIAPPRALAILSGLSAAVDAAHAKGIIHRDLKPENVFLTTDTHAKILDYGIAKNASVSGTNTTGGVLGTLAYMAPEQASGGTPAPAWDVWALSVIAFEMLTGQHPFGGGLPITRAVPVQTLAPNLDESMAQAIDQSLSLSGSDRYAVFSILRSASGR